MSDRLSPLWLFADITARSARGAGHRRAGQAERAAGESRSVEIARFAVTCILIIVASPLAAGSLLVTASALASLAFACDAVRSLHRDCRSDASGAVGPPGRCCNLALQSGNWVRVASLSNRPQTILWRLAIRACGRCDGGPDLDPHCFAARGRCRPLTSRGRDVVVSAMAV
jgi:hypothetical protein